MKSFLIELVSSASLDIYPDNTLAAFTNFLPEQISLDGDWEVAVMEISYPALYHNITDGRFRVKFNAKQTDIPLYSLPPGMYESIDDVLYQMEKEVMLKPPEGYDHISTIVGKVNNRDLRVDFNLGSKDAALNLASPDLAHILGFPDCVLQYGNTFKSPLPADIQRIHSVMIYTDIIEHGIVGDRKAPILRCFPFISRFRNGDTLQPQQVMNYKSFDNLQFRKLLKNSFHSIKIELRSSTGDKIPFSGIGITRITLLFRQQE